MNPASAALFYRRAFGAGGNGEPVLVRRYSGSGPHRPHFDALCLAHVAGYQPAELAGDIQQGDRRVIVLVEDLLARQFPMPVTVNDKIVIRGRECTIRMLDDSTRRLGTMLIAYEARVRG